MNEYSPHYDAEIGYTHLAQYCMIAPDEETLFDPHNSVASTCGS